MQDMLASLPAPIRAWITRAYAPWVIETVDVVGALNDEEIEGDRRQWRRWNAYMLFRLRRLAVPLEIRLVMRAGLFFGPPLPSCNASFLKPCLKNHE